MLKFQYEKKSISMEKDVKKRLLNNNLIAM
jgi:hypothetical protein